LTARIELSRTRRSIVHWYESHGIGRKEFKIKRLLGSGVNHVPAEMSNAITRSLAKA
jgi:hypothetical protein